MQFSEYLAEATKNKTVVFAFGRFNPPTIGHELLVKKVTDTAKQIRADHIIYASRSQDSKKNPLSVQQKVSYLRRMFPNVNFAAANEDVRTFIEVAKYLDKQGYKNIVMVAGSDRISEYEKLLAKYNGKEFNFDSTKVVSAGERDPDAEGASGASGTKMREAAIKNDFESFRRGIPKSLSDKETRALMNAIRLAMNVREFVETDLNTKFEKLISEGVHDKAIFKAVFLSGGPGSGKDYVLDNTLAGHGLVEINSDKALEFLMDKGNLDKRMPESEREMRDMVRGRAKSVTELKQRLALLGRNGLIINGTGDDFDKVDKIKKRLEELGYETSMVTVNTADEVSQKRNVERGQRGGRTVPEDIRKSKWDGVQANRPKFAELFRGNYHEFDNSEDLRSADPKVVEAKKNEMLEIFKKIKDFTTKPAKHPNAQTWIANELNKKDSLKVSTKGAKMAPQSESGAYDQAMKLGLQYMGFGRYGKGGKVTHHSVHDKLIEVGKYKAPEEKKMPVPGTSQTKKVKKVKEDVDSEFETFINEAVTFTIKADTPDELKKTLQLIKSEDEVEDVEEQYALSSTDAFDALTLGTGMVRESVETPKYLTDKNGKPRKFMIRRSASKEAHTKQGEVEKVGNYYLVKLKENTDVSVSKEFIQEGTNRPINTDGATTSYDSTGSVGALSDSTHEKKTLSQVKGKIKSKINEIDFGTEVGMPLAGYNKEKIDRKIGKAVTEISGDETGASNGDQRANELQKQGISLQTFKAKRGNFS